MQISRGFEIQQDNSAFTAYTAKVDNTDDINQLYIKLRMMQPKARHIVCAYSINTENICESLNYFDDGQPGAGRQVVQVLKESAIQDSVVFIARKYGGIKMGANRFLCYTNAARGALGLQPQQSDRISQRNNAVQQSNQSYAPRGRGGRGGTNSQRPTSSTHQKQQPNPPHYAPNRYLSINRPNTGGQLEHYNSALDNYRRMSPPPPA